MDSSSDKKIHLLDTDAIFQNSEIVKANLEREKEILAIADQIFNNEGLSIDEKITQLTDLKKDYLYTVRADTFTMTSSGSLTSIQAREWFSDNQISKHIAYLESVKTGRPLVDLSQKLSGKIFRKYELVQDTDVFENDSVERILFVLSEKDRDGMLRMFPNDFKKLVKDISYLVEKKEVPESITKFTRTESKAAIDFYCYTIWLAWSTLTNRKYGTQGPWKAYIEAAFKNYGNMKVAVKKFSKQPPSYYTDRNGLK